MPDLIEAIIILTQELRLLRRDITDCTAILTHPTMLINSGKSGGPSNQFQAGGVGYAGEKPPGMDRKE